MADLDRLVGQESLDAINRGTMDLKNPVVGGLARKLFGSGLRVDVPTKDLAEAGSKAQAAPVDTTVLQSIGVDVPALQPPAPQQQLVDEPAGITLEDANAALQAQTSGVQLKSPEKMAKEIDGIDPDELAKRNWRRNVNLDYVANAEALGPALEVSAQQIAPAAKRSFDEVRADVDKDGHLNILKDVLKDNSNPRALNDYQLLAGREVMLGLMEKVDEKASLILERKATQEDMLLFDKYQEQAVMLQKYMQGSIRETARALNSMKMVGEAVNSGSIKSISETLASSSNYEKRAMMLLEAKKEGASTADLIEQAGMLSKIKNASSAVTNLWVAGILTGFKTQGVNILSNSFYGSLRSMVIKPTAAGIGVMRESAARTAGKEVDGDRVYLAEVGAEIAAFRQGALDAFKMGKDVWVNGTFKNGGQYQSSFSGARKVEDAETDTSLAGSLGVGQVPGVSQAVNGYQRGLEAISFGSLSAADEVFKALQYRKSLYSLAVRDAYMKGLPDAEIPAYVNEQLSKLTREMHDQALRDAEDVTFTNRMPGGSVLAMISDAAVRVTQAVPPLKIIAPFIRTPTALFDRTIKSTPLALLQKEFYERVQKGGADADMAMAEMAAGTAITAFMMYLYNEGVVTGGGPEDFRQRKALEKSGWQPNSILVDGTYVSYNRGFEPIAPPIAAITGLLDRAHYASERQSAEEIAAGTVFAISKYFLDNTYMRGVSNIMSVVEGRASATQYFSQQASSIVPALLRDAAQIQRGVAGEEQTPIAPRSNQFWEQLKDRVATRMPFQDSPAIQRYWDGTPVVAGGGEALFLYNSVSPVRVSRLQGTDGRAVDPGNDALVENYVAPSDPPSRISLDATLKNDRKTGIKVDLLNDLNNGAELYDKLTELVGQQRRIAVDSLVNSEIYKNLVEKGLTGAESPAAIALEKALIAGMQSGRDMFIQWLIDEQEAGRAGVDTHGEAMQMLQPDSLKQMLQSRQAGTLSTTDEEFLGQFGAKGLSTRKPVEAPVYVPDI